MSNELSAALELHQAGQLDAAAQIYSRLFENDRNNAEYQGERAADSAGEIQDSDGDRDNRP